MPPDPEGWTVTGGTARSKRLAAGDALEATGRSTVPADGASGTVEVPITVELPDGDAARTSRRARPRSG